MAYQALYRQYRPQTFDDVVEQQHVVKTLKNTVISKKAAHAYLFCGTRGTGKTTMAKIFARALNCLAPLDGNPCNSCEVCLGIINGTILDVTEIDAASNNSVDNVRSIIDEVVYTPTRAAKKVYIIDEVHMLSTGAFNALLKTLEEPPEHVIFILATTEPHKLPATVLSRCQRFDFRRITAEGIAKRLLNIAEELGVTITNGAVHFIASLSEGALRDGISILDQCIATGKDSIDLNLVEEVAGIASGRLVLETVKALNERKADESIITIDKLFLDGKDFGHYLQKIIQVYRDILVYKSLKNTDNLLSMTDETRDAIPVLSNSVSFEETLAIVRELSELESGIKWSTSPRIILETAFIRICSRELNRDRDDLSERIKFLESRIRSLEERLSGNIEIINRNHVDAPVEGHKESKPEARNDRILDSILIEPETKKIKETASQTGKCDEWGNVIKELKRMGRMAVAANLAETTALWSSSDSIDIQIPNEDEYRKRVLSKLENTDAIKEALKRELGRSINIRIVNMKDEKKTDEREIEDEIPERLRQFVKKKGINLELVDE